jgi:hypothetical protein
MNIPDYFFESLETVFRVKNYLNSLKRIRDGIFLTQIRDEHPGSATLFLLIPVDLQEKLKKGFRNLQ